MNRRSYNTSYFIIQHLHPSPFDSLKTLNYEFSLGGVVKIDHSSDVWVRKRTEREIEFSRNQKFTGS